VSIFFFFFFVLLYFVSEIAYFKIAEKRQFIDKPNERSSHFSITLRGGGIIFPIAFLIPLLINPFNNWSVVAIGLIIISVISFLDDMFNLSSQIRLLVQCLSVALMIWCNMNSLHFLLSILAIICAVGIINAYNFMDGINGITAFYSITIISTLYWVNDYVSKIVPNLFFISLLSALLIFSYFNARRKARCFAGDIGSVSIAFIICFLLFTLCMQTKTFLWLLFLWVYGVDTVFTICCRLVRKESIFQAHRSHFYQFLANEGGWSHLEVSSLYAITQLLLNVIIIFSYMKHVVFLIILSIIGILVIYTIFRLQYEGKYRLFTAY